MKNIYLSNYYKNAHTIYKDMINESTIKDEVNYIPIKKIKFLSYIKRVVKNLFLFKLPFYENEIIKGDKGIIFNLGIINYSNLDSYFFLEHFFILNANFKILRIPFVKNIIRKILEHTKCKGIVCLSNEAKNRIDDYFGSEIIKSKTSFIYPSIGYNPLLYKKDSTKFRILFIANWDFISKGGREVIKCYEIFFRNNHEFEFIIKCNNIPKEYKISGENIKYIEENISYKEVETLYQQAHILLQPLYKSGYGVFLEGMKYGLPIITSKVFDIPEIIKDGVNGFTIDFVHSLFDTKDFYKIFDSVSDFDRYIVKSNISQTAVDELYKAIIKLKEDQNLYYEISQNNRYEVESGRFSRQERDNNILKLILKSDKN